jgi:hypothetical protein
VNLKKVELPVKQIVSGRVIKASGTLANPESLKFYEQFARVEEVLEKGVVSVDVSRIRRTPGHTFVPTSHIY